MSEPDRDLVRFVSSDAVFTGRSLEVEPNATPPAELAARGWSEPGYWWFRYELVVTRAWKGVSVGDTVHVWDETDSMVADMDRMRERMSRRFFPNGEFLVYAHAVDGHIRINESCVVESVTESLGRLRGELAVSRTHAVLDRLREAGAPLELDAFERWLIEQQSSEVRYPVFVQTVDLSSGAVSPIADTTQVWVLLPYAVHIPIRQASADWDPDRVVAEEDIVWPDPASIPVGAVIHDTDRAAGQVRLEVPSGIYRISFDGRPVETRNEEGEVVDRWMGGGAGYRWMVVLAQPRAVQIERVWNEYAGL